MAGGEGGARRASRGGPLRWIVFSALVPLAFAAVVVALNAGVYSPAGFVDRYVDALERRDLAVALEMPGVSVPAGTSRAALERDAMLPVEAHRVVESTDAGDGRHRVTVEFDLGSGAEPATTQFHVRAAEPAFLLFNSWRFAESPVATVTVAVRGDDTFRLNGVAVGGAQPIQPGVWALDVAVLSPGRVVLDQDSRYLAADDVTVDVTDASAPVTATVDVRANDRFIDSVQTEVNEFLDECAAQQVLQPAGCPFRRTLDDRILNAPEWSIVAYPKIGIEPRVAEDGTFAWVVPPADGTAHIRVRVLSLFDGSVSDLDDDVPFRVAYTLGLRDDGGMDIRAVRP